MNSETAVLHEAEPREILEALIKEKTPAILSYLSNGKWHALKVQLAGLGANALEIQVSPRDDNSNSRKESRRLQNHPEIRIEQPIGLSVKYRYGKFIFDTTVVGFKPPADPTMGATITVAVPQKIEMVQRRSYFRVEVPKKLKVDVVLWHRRRFDPAAEPELDDNPRNWPEGYWQGRLVDISAGGAQLTISAEQHPDFKQGQFIGLRFTPVPYETPLLLNAQIRHILPTVDGRSLCYGLQLVGLEVSLQGRENLQKLCGLVEQYYHMNQEQPEPAKAKHI